MWFPSKISWLQSKLPQKMSKCCAIWQEHRFTWNWYSEMEFEFWFVGRMKNNFLSFLMIDIDAMIDSTWCSSLCCDTQICECDQTKLAKVPSLNQLLASILLDNHFNHNESNRNEMPSPAQRTFNSNESIEF